MAVASVPAPSREVQIPCGDPGVVYREIVGFPDYAVGDDGSIWSNTPRRIANAPDGSRQFARAGWKRLRTTVDKDLGYAQVVLHGNGVKRKMRVHRIVLEAFVGPCPPGMEACHGPDHVRTNNRMSNLRWGTRQSNVDDMLAQGRSCAGEKSVTAKLTWDIVDEIRRRFPNYRSRKTRNFDRQTILATAAEFGLHSESVYRILNERQWKPSQRPGLAVGEDDEPGFDRDKSAPSGIDALGHDH